uniref:Uncharacterized protein n=1 Tax=Arundo donax TaxID=35708 RepID=A0A0A8XY12_ARUDO
MVDMEQSEGGIHYSTLHLLHTCYQLLASQNVSCHKATMPVSSAIPIHRSAATALLTTLPKESSTSNCQLLTTDHLNLHRSYCLARICSIHSARSGSDITRNAVPRPWPSTRYMSAMMSCSSAKPGMAITVGYRSGCGSTDAVARMADASSLRASQRWASCWTLYFLPLLLSTTRQHTAAAAARAAP